MNINSRSSSHDNPLQEVKVQLTNEIAAAVGNIFSTAIWVPVRPFCLEEKET